MIDKFLKKIVLEVGEYQLKSLNDKIILKTKENDSIVTEIDEISEQMIIEAVTKEFPGSTFIGEESGETSSVGDSDLEWIIDPLDGTTNYSHGLPLYAISIGVREKQKLKYGVIYCPGLKELYYTEKNQGAFLNNQPIKVSNRDKFRNSLFGTGFYYSDDKIEVMKGLERFARVQVASFGVRRPGAAAIDLAWVASGRYDAYWELGIQSWDISAGVLLIEEAGGRVTKIDGSPHDLFGRNILASNGLLHDEMVKILNLSF